MYLFNKDITTWEKWGKAFQDTDAFSQLLKHIFKTEGLPLLQIVRSTPGTNAVFDCGNYFTKIYAPQETGISGNEADSEFLALKRAAAQKVPCPKIIGRGQVHDKYLFRYIILEKIIGTPAAAYLSGCSADEKSGFVQSLNDILSKINTLAPNASKKLKERVYSNGRWDIFSSHVKEQVHSFVSGINISDFVYVHGDLTDDNVIINEKGLNIIDFGDAQPAPMYYEYPPIIFELFGHDKELTRLFAESRKDFQSNLFRATLLHDFGGLFVRDICVSKLGIQPEKLSDITVIQDYIKSLFVN
jgi:tRNA A-37 threonylcarbamoyl transferase component Bud32